MGENSLRMTERVDSLLKLGIEKRQMMSGVVITSSLCSFLQFPTHLDSRITKHDMQTRR